MKKGQKIILYGMGNWGEKIINALDENNENILYEIIAYMDKEKKFCLGHEVIGPEKLDDLTYDYIVILTKKYFENIRWELNERYHVDLNKMIQWQQLVEGENYSCNICGKSASFFWSSGTKSELFKKKKVVGGGERNNAICPFCNSMDRFRWLQYVLATQTDIYTKQNVILHFAPEVQIAEKIRRNNPGYLSADIVEGRADVVEDITKLSFADQTFDYIIFNHVLEHIKDEESALKEVKRCIKLTGKIILSVPICWEEKTFERDDIVTPQEREIYYGQEDHVRLYGYDFPERMEEYGFEVQRCSYHRNQFGEEIRKLSLLENDTIWILSRKEKG